MYRGRLRTRWYKSAIRYRIVSMLLMNENDESIYYSDGLYNIEDE